MERDTHVERPVPILLTKRFASSQQFDVYNLQSGSTCTRNAKETKGDSSVLTSKADRGWNQLHKECRTDPIQWPDSLSFMLKNADHHGWWIATELQQRSQMPLVHVILKISNGKEIPQKHTQTVTILSTTVTSPSSEVQPLKTLALGGDGAPIEGDAIQAVAHGQRNIRFVESKLELHLCYRIQRYVCTEVDKPEDFLCHYFEPMIYDELHSICDKKDEVTDYIGFLQRKEYRPTKSKDDMLKLTISNSIGRRVTAALWKEVNQLLEKVDRQQLEDTELPALIAVSSVKVTDFMGSLQLQSTPTTYLYINPVSPVIDSLLDSLRETEERRQHAEALAPPPVPVNGDKMTIAELQQLDRDMLNDRTVIVEGAVTEVHISKGWFYNACTNCPSPAKKSGDQWACASDGRFPAPRPTYCIGTTIADHTGSIRTTLFDKAARLFVGKECSELIVNEGYADPAIIPEPVQATRGKRMAFHLELQRDARPGRVSMTVTQVTEILIAPVLQIEASEQQPLSLPASVTATTAPQMKSEPQPTGKKLVSPVAAQVKPEPQPTEKKPVKRVLDFGAEGSQQPATKKLKPTE
ncbi:hypothetical protein SSX86_024672 [Deinandra increscens subsp. villosa]|uniref:Replication factor A C-terminal domain-containing protein n=1 Tax=Deinandra increscens subsp. villosa TaxID=3103831 RepID=A0AAP0CE48_9ASTR